jgi:SET domain-containing protein
MNIAPAWYELPFVSQWKLKIAESEKWGKFLKTGKPIPASSVVMVLLPINIKHRKDMQPMDYNRSIQLSSDLFSCSADPSEYNNYICHSCDPTCEILKGSNNTIYLIARRDISEGDSISFDYNTTEENMVQQGVDFECHCGMETCQKWIRGWKYLSSPLSQSPSHLSLVTSLIL